MEVEKGKMKINFLFFLQMFFFGAAE